MSGTTVNEVERDTQPVEADTCVSIQSATLNEASTGARILVIPWGEVRSSNGNFALDADSAREVVEAFVSHGTDLPIDYEHQSLGGTYASPSGQAPAAGWIRVLEAVEPGEDEEPGLYAEVTWTEAAAKQLASREYRYLSPVVMVRTRDRRVVSLHSVALTNKPAIVGMRPIVNRETVEPSDAVHEVSAVGEDLEQLRCRLGLGDDTTAVGVMKAADAEIERLQKAAASRAADDRVAEAVRAGKLAPAQHEWAHQLALKNPTDFDAWLADAPTVVVMGRLTDSASVSAGSPRRQIVASARAEYRANEMLSSLTTESAWIANALRERGFDMIKEDGAGH